MVERLRARDLTAGDEWSNQVSKIECELLADLEYWRVQEAKLHPDESNSNYSPALNNLQANTSAIRRCLAIVQDEMEYIQTPAFKALSDPLLLVNGEWGTGKTHLMCDATQNRADRGQVTLLTLAKNFQGSILKEICARIEVRQTVVEIFDQIHQLAIENSERAVIIIDGINEGRRREWRQAITTLLDLIAVRPNIGLIVTCRTPFAPIAITQGDLRKFHNVSHLGFDDQEFDAQATFFQYYSLPLPEVPLLDREFSRPLTLKLICQSLQNLAGKKLAKGFAGIASGQRGMTYVLESFVNRVSDPIEREYGLLTRGCWGLLKGSDLIANKQLAGFAPCMAANLRSYVLLAEADRIVAANFPTLRPAQRKRLIEELRTSGLIEEDVIWYSTKAGIKSRIVLRLPYQRFSDHLIARHLLKMHLDTSSVASIKRSFTDDSPLARIFGMPRVYSKQYAEPGWAQALITEFPERVGKRLPRKQQELFFMLPKHSQSLEAYFDPFIDGIFWRNPAAFTEGTRILINQYLNAESGSWERTVDALAAVSTKPKHPYHARRLYNFLAKYSMANRDLCWSEYLRRKYKSPTIHRLLTWAEKLDTTHMKKESAMELVVLLSLILTTVVRRDRDVATKVLVLIGEKFPEVLFSHVATSLEFNDPYLPERVLAAAYGTTLSLVDSEATPTFRPQLGKLAKLLYQKMFAPNARFATHHTLMRDYALGIIQIAQRANCVSLPKTATKNLSFPFPNTSSTFASDGTPDSIIKEAIGNAIQMDFGNYTMGRLIPQRANYDEKNPEYVQVRAKIERRIFDLGYRAKRFRLEDIDIGRSAWNASDNEKVDRYGKKYSWIAYFEMWGEREALRELPDWRLDSRTSDCGVDPSFPKRPPEWKPPLPNLFGDTAIQNEDWIRSEFTPKWSQLLVVPEINGHPGDWVLIGGHIRGIDECHDRQLFAFLRGMFVARRDVSDLKEKFYSVKYPGNDKIPEPATEHYLYAGEAGRRGNYARHLRQQNGRYRRQIVETFDEYVQIHAKTKAVRIAVKAPPLANAGNRSGSSFAELLGPIPKMRHIPGIKVEVPLIHFGWESYHSAQNEFSGFDLPSPTLIQSLGLASKYREIDFYDPMNKPATIYRESGDDWKGNRHSLLYIRADLLRNYLRKTRQVLVWCNWGERDWLKKMEDHHVIVSPSRQSIYQSHDNIHRSFFQWCAKNSEIL
ncbi:MAG TPA: hypothetical protein VIT92_00155 [Burkholderiaceae bacterium]